MSDLIDFDDVKRFCATRSVDLTMACPPPPFTVCLHGEFDGYGDFFSLLVKDVDYVEIAGAFPVGDIVIVSDLATLPSLLPRWSRLVESCSGTAVAFRSDDTPQWGDGAECFIVVADHLEWRSGGDWPHGGGSGCRVRL